MKLRGSVDGLESLRGGLARLADRMALADALAAAGEAVRAAARANLRDGQSPENRRNELPDSLSVNVAGDGSSVTVSTTRAEGWHAEFGTLARPATPWLEPALEAARPGILAHLRRWLAAPPRR